MEQLEIVKNTITNKFDRELFLYAIKDGVKFERAMSTYELYKKNSTLMKNNNVVAANFMDKSINGKKCFELFTDSMQKKILENKAKKLIKSVFSSKYKHLINDETLDLFRCFSECNVDKSFFQKGLAKKIAAFKTSQELNTALSKELEKISQWSKYYQKKIITSENTTILKETEDSIIFEVNDYSACKRLGTDMWCIVREEETFNDYREDVERVYFKYDFKSTSEKNNAMTAYIVNASGGIHNGYFKDDTIMTDSELKENGMLELFDSYRFDEFSERISDKCLSVGEEVLFFYLHGMEKELKENVFDEELNVQYEDLKNILSKHAYNSNLKTFYINVINDRDLLLNNHIDKSINLIQEYVGTRYNKDMNEVISEMLNVEEYNPNSPSLYDFISNNNIDLNKKNIEKFLDKKNTNIHNEIVNYISEGNSIYFKIRDAIELIGDYSFTETIINELPENIAVGFIKSNILSNPHLLSLDKNIEKIVDIVEKTNIELDSIVLDKVKEEAFNKGIPFEKIETKKKDATLEYIIKNPRKAFIKKSLIEQEGISLNKEDTLKILKKAFFEDVKDFNKYDLEDVGEDILHKMNDKNIQILFSNNNFLNNEGKKEFVEFLEKSEPRYDIENVIKNIRYFKKLINKKENPILNEKKYYKMKIKK